MGVIGDRWVGWKWGFRHGTLDLGAFVLKGSEGAMGRVWEVGGVGVGERVFVGGFVVEGEGEHVTFGEEQLVAGTIVRVEERAGRGFVGKLEGVVGMGMCGGPVFDEGLGNVVGLVEGAVPEGCVGEVGYGEVKGCAVFITGKEIREFVKDVEDVLVKNDMVDDGSVEL